MNPQFNWRTVIVACLAGALIWAALIDGIAHASPTQAQVKHAIDPAFRKTPHVALAVLALAALADVLTTKSALHRGCHEANPVFGRHPSTAALLLTHGGVVGFAWATKLPAWADYTGAALFTAAAIHNATTHCLP